MRDRILRFWTDAVLARPRLILAILLASLVLAALIVPGLKVEAGHSKLESPDNIHQRRFREFLTNFGSPNSLIVMVEGGDETLRRQLVDRLIKDLPPAQQPTKPVACDAAGGAGSPGCVRDVVGRLELSRLKANALLFLPYATLKDLVLQLEGEQLGLAAAAQIKDLPSLLSAVNDELERRSKQPPPTGEAVKHAEEAMKLTAWALRQLATRIKSPTEPAQSLEEALAARAMKIPQVKEQLRKHGSRGVDLRGYLSSADGKLKLAFIRPANDSDEPAVVVPFVQYVQRRGLAAVQSLAPRCKPGGCPDGPLKVTLTGLPAIVADETAVLGRDITLTTVVAICGILALFYFGFRSLRQTLLGLLPLLTGLLWTLAFVRLAFGSLNLVTSAFIVTLLGLGIDFAVHLMSRFNEARQAGKDPVAASRAAVMGAGPGILTGALTTSGAFIALAASRFMAFSQLGIITGVGLLCVLLVTLSMLPALLALPSLARMVGTAKSPGPPRPPRFDLPGLVVRRRYVFVIGGLAVAAGMALAAQRIPWSYNYMELMPRGLASVQAMQDLASKTDYSAEVAAVVAKDEAQAAQFTRLLAAKKTVARVESVTAFLPQDQQRKLTLLRRLKPRLQGRTRRVNPAVDLAQLDESLEELQDTLQDIQFDAKRANRSEARLLQGPMTALGELRAAIKQAPPDQARQRLGKVQGQLLSGLDQGLDMLWKGATGGPVTAASLLASLPPGFRDRLFHDGRYAVYTYPARPIWDKGFMAQLVRDLRSVSPEATGFPVTHWETSNAIEAGFRDASIIASVMLVLLLLLDFRNLRYTLMAVAPLAMGITWMWGGMSLLNISYNFVNVIAFPLIIGIGVASGVHILHRYRQEGEQDVAPVVRFTGMAIFLSAATTMVGFGSLTLAHHRGAASLGQVLLLGVGACLATSVLFLPALLRVLKRDQQTK